MAKTPRNRPLNNYLPIFQEMEHADDRTAAIVAASLVENNLVLVIRKRLRDDLEDVEVKRLFDNRGAVMSTFADKIDMGFALNLYDALVRDDLDRIREIRNQFAHHLEIRNQFAHHLEIRNFDHPDVAGKCEALQATKYFGFHPISRAKVEPTRKHIYIDTAAFLALHFERESKKAHRPPKPMFLQYVWSIEH
jgi:hypothetical protein